MHSEGGDRGEDKCSSPFEILILYYIYIDIGNVFGPRERYFVVTILCISLITIEITSAEIFSSILNCVGTILRWVSRLCRSCSGLRSSDGD